MLRAGAQMPMQHRNVHFTESSQIRATSTVKRCAQSPQVTLSSKDEVVVPTQ
jgi:hypothetical protein